MFGIGWPPAPPKVNKKRKEVKALLEKTRGLRAEVENLRTQAVPVLAASCHSADGHLGWVEKIFAGWLDRNPG